VKMEFLAGGAPECPLIRLYDFTTDEARELRQVFYSLADGSLDDVALDGMPFIEAVHGCQLRLLLGASDRGIRPISSDVFEYTLTGPGWSNVGGLVDPFTESNSRGFQWLSNRRPVRLLLSRDGGW